MPPPGNGKQNPEREVRSFTWKSGLPIHLQGGPKRNYFLIHGKGSQGFTEINEGHPRGGGGEEGTMHIGTKGKLEKERKTGHPFRIVHTR